MTDRRAWIPAAVTLLAVYTLTLAPSVTFWDAGEFMAAAHALGIPHPPGTPLFILLLHAWGMPWPDSFYAWGLNFASAVATTAAASLAAVLVFRWLGRKWDARWAMAGATAAAICAGAMFTVWSNATETEVYAASLALAIASLFAADRRQELLVAYCFGLAAALHVSALVASPAAIILCASRDERIDLGVCLRLGAAALGAMAIGTWNPTIGMLAVVGCVVACCLPSACHPERSEGSALTQVNRSRSLASLRMTTLASLRMTTIAMVIVVLGASPLLFMLIRAGHDPAINQGNPATLQAFMDVIARRQYDLAPLWPRRAPLWLQMANWFEYADWQAALSLAPGVIPSIPRVIVSLIFAALAMVGAAEHRRIDRRSWRALLALFVAGTIGVTLYLNLRASPSFGWGIIPDDAQREARERDYFFVLGFFTAGLWAGIGAVTLAARRRLPLTVGIAVAAVPIALNWTAVDRRREPDASLPRTVAKGLITMVPERAVLFVAGDNDSYPVWFTSEVLKERADLTLVTVPLIGAGWYVEELIRRNPELASAKTSEGVTARTIADAARGAGRPVAASLTLFRSDRISLNGCWRVIGLALLDDPSADNCLFEDSPGGSQAFPLDIASMEQWRRLVAPARIPAVKPGIDPVGDYFARVLNCPHALLEKHAKTGRGVSLDSTCNL